MNLSTYNLTVEQIAEKLGYTTQTVRNLAAAGKLPAMKRFRRWLFSEQEVLEALKNSTGCKSQLNRQSSVADDNGIDRAADSDKANSELLR